jgi:hypothetical protein
VILETRSNRSIGPSSDTVRDTRATRSRVQMISPSTPSCRRGSQLGTLHLWVLRPGGPNPASLYLINRDDPARNCEICDGIPLAKRKIGSQGSVWVRDRFCIPSIFTSSPRMTVGSQEYQLCSMIAESSYQYWPVNPLIAVLVGCHRSYPKPVST